MDCYWCGRPLTGDTCPGCRQRGLVPDVHEVVDHVCDCERLPLLDAADALRQAATALERAARDQYRLGDIVHRHQPAPTARR